MAIWKPKRDETGNILDMLGNDVRWSTRFTEDEVAADAENFGMTVEEYKEKYLVEASYWVDLADHAGGVARLREKFDEYDEIDGYREDEIWSGRLSELGIDEENKNDDWQDKLDEFFHDRFGISYEQWEIN